MASHNKSDIIETQAPVAVDVEKRSSSDSDEFVLATKAGNDQDHADMHRLGKKQQLNVHCTPSDTRMIKTAMLMIRRETSSRSQF